MFYGYELELAAMTRNQPDDDANEIPYPLLLNTVGFHAPGRTTEAPSMMYQHLADVGHPAGPVAADRAHFHEPLSALGHRFHFDYRKDQLGNKDSYEQFILVEGQWYLHCMPKRLINASGTTASSRPSTARNETIALKLVSVTA